jgi:hypothetical protein
MRKLLILLCAAGSWLTCYCALAGPESRPARDPAVVTGRSIFEIDEKALAPAAASPWRLAREHASQPAATEPTRSIDKIAIPALSLRVASSKLAEDVFASELKDTSSSGRHFLAELLLQEANKSTISAADRFVLLIGAAQDADDASDLRLCFRALGIMQIHFDIEVLRLQTRAAFDTTIDRGSADQSLANVRTAMELIDPLVAADRLSDASRLLAVLAAPAARDPSCAAEVKKQIARLEQLARARATAEPNLAKLRASPANPAANLVAGRYLCFYLAEWDVGLPMLRKGDDKKLKGISIRELNAPSDAPAQMAIADAWWDIAQEQRGLVQEQIQAHARKWYTSALPKLAGLDRSKVEMRLGPPRTADTPKTIDLLQLIDPARDTVQGRFALQNGELVSTGTGQQRIEVRYVPPEEYDFEIEYTRFAADGPVIQILSRQGTPFIWVMETKDLAFHYFDNGADFTNPTILRINNAIRSGVLYRSVVEVRNGGVRTFLNGALIKELKTDYRHFAPDRPFWKLRDNSFIGLGVVDRVVVYSAKVTEVTGKGRIKE